MSLRLHTLYRHYKGGLYVPVSLAERHTHNGDLDVVYISLTHGKHCTRPYARDSRGEDAWTDIVLWRDGENRLRFSPETGALASIFSYHPG